MLGNDARQNVFAEIVMGLGILGIRQKHRNHQLGIENVDAHRSVAVSGVVRGFLGSGGLFLEADNAPILVDFNDPKLPGGLHAGNLNRAHGDVGT